METKLKPDDWGVYVITDEDLSNCKSHAEIVRLALEGGADIVQLREKKAEGGRFYRAAKEIREITAAAGVTFIVNDRIDIAMAVNADGVHVGQEDIPANVARELIGNQKILGVSARTKSEIDRAVADGADYIGYGPIYEARSTKPDTVEPQGLKKLAEIRGSCPVPLVAIGGIKMENAGEVIRHGADGLAVISGIVSQPDITRAVIKFKEVVREARSK
ncbi:MAG: thiamine phosphate synthase [candidate division Zixibacteria bacterium]|nr:thiamine phosphate synthase [candidate division Zixibacteria bacterium]